MNRLQLPHGDDSIAEMARKLTALAKAVQQGHSIAAVTFYAASMTQNREPMNTAVAEMTPQEHEAWSQYTTGKYPLPSIDWNSNRRPAPTSTRPLRIAHRRAETLNRLYNTEKAEVGHSVWFVEHEAYHLPLVKAMARLIGADRNLLGGQYALNALQMADLQTINQTLSVSTEALKKNKGSPMSREIALAQQVLIAQRDTLRTTLTKKEKKRKADSQDDDDQTQAPPSELTVMKRFKSEGALTLYRLSSPTPFHCGRCKEGKTAKLVATYCNQWNDLRCNGCYGKLLSEQIT